MNVSACTKTRNRETITVPAYRVSMEAGKMSFLPYGEPSGFFDFFLPRNGWMLKAASFSLS